MSAGVEGSKRLHSRSPARLKSQLLAAETAAANLARSTETELNEPSRSPTAPTAPESVESADSEAQPDPQRPRPDRAADAPLDPDLPEPDRSRHQARRNQPSEHGSEHGSDAEAEPHDHHLLIDAHEDRWAWRRRIRQNPRKLFFYRICVALLGLLLLFLALVTGPLPGPGGIPIALLGIAVWSSEFEWAQRLMLWFKAQLKRYLALPRSRRLLFWGLFGLGCATLAYLFLLTVGVPFWVPEFAANFLRQLPGV